MQRMWLGRLGMALDRLLNVLLFWWTGSDTETVSHHMATDAASSPSSFARRRGCIACALLSMLVERDHCTKALDPNYQEAAGAVFWAGVWIFSFYLIWWVASYLLLGMFW